MPNDKIDKKAPMPPYKGKSFPLMDTFRTDDPKSLVKPRQAKVTADAPKMETESSPTGDIFTPDKSGVSSIHDR